jgi:16S rRNA (uracil1498-N3)-methyltransferase
VVERADRAAVATFYAPGDWGATVELDDAAAHHAGVKRLAKGDVVRLTSGDGRRATGTIAALAKRHLSVALDAESAEFVAALPRVELWAPVGDRERMLLLAEKAAELGASAWRPVVYRRSRSVTPRGEGEAFGKKVRLRMISGLEQSGGAWLPELHAERTLERALSESNSHLNGQSNGVAGMLLDAAGAPFPAVRDSLTLPLAVALGPEGGLEPDERERFLAAGWRAVSLGANVLRFETAGIAALALVRSLTA